LGETAQELRERTVENFLDILILTNLRKNSLMSANDLMGRIHRKFGVSLSSGILYSCLFYLERAGFIHEDFVIKKHARIRTVYSITQKGTEKIDITREHKSAIQLVIDEIFEE